MRTHRHDEREQQEDQSEPDFNLRERRIVMLELRVKVRKAIFWFKYGFWPPESETIVLALTDVER